MIRRQICPYIKRLPNNQAQGLDPGNPTERQTFRKTPHLVPQLKTTFTLLA